MFYKFISVLFYNVLSMVLKETNLKLGLQKQNCSDKRQKIKQNARELTHGPTVVHKA